jgi:sugar-specific transcriptional regulator TrmB
MTTDQSVEEAISILQRLGLKEYEAKCFVGLTRFSSGTAKQLSEVTDVPRTRIYDSIRVLESQGLVEVQHTSPQQFRAVPLEEATETLREQYEDRISRLSEALRQADALEPETEEPVQEVWSMTGPEAIANRTEQLIDDATEEVVLVIGDPAILTDELVSHLNDVATRVDLLIGAVSEELGTEIESAVPDAQTFLSGLDWLSDGVTGNEVAIGRLMLVDRSTILVSTLDATTTDEHAIFGGGFKNGLVVIARRLMAQGLVPARDPSQLT